MLRDAATKRYQKRFIPLLIVYAVILVAAEYWFASGGPEGPIRYLIAILPALPIVGIVIAMGRYLVEQNDEYQRMLIVRQALVAIGFTLAITAIWGFLENFGMVPHVPAYWVFVLFCIGLGLGQCWNRFRR